MREHAFIVPLLLFCVTGICADEPGSGGAKPIPVRSPATASSPTSPAGKLTIGEHPNQIGLIAQRTFEEDGRVIRIIHYRLGPSAKPSPPVKESDLVEAGVTTIKYDANGRENERHTTGLTSVVAGAKTEYNEDGSPREIAFSDAGERTSHRNLYRNNMCVTELHYNADGAVAGIRGEVAPKHDLPAWGKAVDDVVCAVLPTSDRRTFVGMGLWITARNTGKGDRKIVTIGKDHPEFLVEVRRADGTLVEQDPEYVKKHFEERQRGNPNDKDVAQTLSPGKAELVQWGQQLSHWYADLPPGKYQVAVTCRAGEEFNVVSNAAAFEIVAIPR
jgi:hypothetical protein